MSRFPRFKPRRQLYAARQWPGFAVKVTAEDGTWGLGTAAGRPAAAVVEDAFAHILTGEDCLAIDKLWDMMFRVSKPFGTVGIATVAISAVDLALWDLAGKLQQKPVYQLIGGPARERIFTYAPATMSIGIANWASEPSNSLANTAPPTACGAWTKTSSGLPKSAH